MVVIRQCGHNRGRQGLLYQLRPVWHRLHCPPSTLCFGKEYGLLQRVQAGLLRVDPMDTLGAVVLGNCSACHGMFSSIHGFCPLGVRSTPSCDNRNVSRRCQTSSSRGKLRLVERQPRNQSKGVTKSPKSPSPAILSLRQFQWQTKLARGSKSSCGNMWYWGGQCSTGRLLSAAGLSLSFLWVRQVLAQHSVLPIE